MPLLGEEVCVAAKLPDDVERYFFSTYRPPTTVPGKPGCFVPPVVPEEVIERVLTAYRPDASKADDAVKLEMELQARRAYISDPSMYHPWTGDRLCTPCTLFRTGPWSYHGVRAIKDTSFVGTPDDAQRFFLTCGMLKDVGVISDRAGCDAVEAELTQKYNQYIIERERAAKRTAKSNQLMGYIRLAMEVVVTVVATVVTGPGGAAVATAFYALEHMTETAISGEKITADAALKTLGSVVVGMVPLIGPVAGAVVKGVYEVAVLAKEFYEYTEARKEMSKANDAKEASVKALLDELSDLIKERASLEELAAATKIAKAELDAVLVEKRAVDRQKWIIGGVAAAVAALFFLGRR